MSLIGRPDAKTLEIRLAALDDELRAETRKFNTVTGRLRMRIAQVSLELKKLLEESCGG